MLIRCLIRCQGSNLSVSFYEILRRLLAPTQPTHPADVSCLAIPMQDGQLVIDPTIDAWEHSGIYPQGYNPSPTREGGRPEDVQSPWYLSLGGGRCFSCSQLQWVPYLEVLLAQFLAGLATRIPSTFAGTSACDNRKSPPVG